MSKWNMIDNDFLGLINHGNDMRQYQPKNMAHNQRVAKKARAKSMAKYYAKRRAKGLNHAARKQAA